MILLKLKILYQLLKYYLQRLWRKESGLQFFRSILYNPNPYLVSKIKNWQFEEKLAREKNPNSIADFIEENKLLSRNKEFVHWKVMEIVKYQKEERDRWKTSNETINDKKGDCEDQAILLYSIFSQLYFSSGKFFIGIIPGHAFCSEWIEDENDFWVYDNGSMTHIRKRASEIFPHNDKLPLVGFTINDQWEFNVRGKK